MGAEFCAPGPSVARVTGRHRAQVAQEAHAAEAESVLGSRMGGVVKNGGWTTINQGGGTTTRKGR